MPLAVIARAQGGQRITGLNRAAKSAGLRTGMLLTDACAMLPSLVTRPQNLCGEQRDLKELASLCNRFSPWVAPDEPDGLWIEASGLAHLFGGEDKLLGRILFYLAQLGFEARGAMAGTAGAAWGLARFAGTSPLVLPAGEDLHALASLPVKALRLDAESVALLERLGLKTIRQLIVIPRSSLRTRFGKAITPRLDQAFGRNGEALSPLIPEATYAARQEFADPLTAFEGLSQVALKLIGNVTASLKADGKGSRRFTLTLFDTQNGKTDVSFKMARPSADPKHIGRVLREKLSKLEGRFDASLGFDAITLYAMSVEALTHNQIDLLGNGSGDSESHDHLTRFIDRVTARLGEQAVTQFAFAESHLPERASSLAPASTPPSSAQPVPLAHQRPLTLLPTPEPIRATALLPDYPPRQFIWRRRKHIVAKAEGPERISPEWWREGKSLRARDYYIVEDEHGQRFWVYREGLYEQSRQQNWFLHGLFA